MRIVLRVYDFFSRHRRLLWLLMVASVAVFAVFVSKLRYSEDIGDFLPVDPSGQRALAVYQNISGADNLFVLFRNPGDADLTVEAADKLVEIVQGKDSLGWCASLAAGFDMGQIQEVTDFVYENVPYFLTENDYARMDSLLSVPEYIDGRIERNKQMLMYPVSGMVMSSLMRDPLGLFAPVMESLKGNMPLTSMELYGGYAFTPDRAWAVAMLESPFGSSETENNAKLLELLEGAISEMEESYPTVEAHVIGGPAIAVGNADRIKKDSAMAIALSVVLILAFVFYSIGSLRNILLLFLSIGWGWLFALAGMSLLDDSVSVIVLGISSAILGIAINYPLHLVVHRGMVPDMRTALKEVVSPLVIGNLTTVGAFLALVPLRSTALRDLGLFAALLLAGTILFVLFGLPHLVKARKMKERKIRLLDRLAGFSPEKYKPVVLGVILLTVFLSLFSGRAGFDSELSNINYMTEEQRNDMRYFQNLFAGDSAVETRSVYVLSSGKDYEEALAKNALLEPVLDSLRQIGLLRGYSGVSRFLATKEEQGKRLRRWQDFVSRHEDELTEGLAEAASRSGFSSSAFAPFVSLLEKAQDFEPEDIGYFSTLTETVLGRNMTRIEDGTRFYVVDVLEVKAPDVESVKANFPESFDIAGLNSRLSKSLSDDFDYIGWACSLIVFFFLWFSFGRVELAILSFLPMALSWVWILGIMALLGIDFNIVNVILATFIFGQGDDYTIFMTEGCQHEYAYGRPILDSYKSSILQSALIMFIGIGTLIISAHPALRTLAEVTIIGMSSVVLMSYMIPPLLFKWLTMKNGQVRRHPLSWEMLFRHRGLSPASQVRGRYLYKGRDILRVVDRNLKGFDPRTAKVSEDGRTCDFADPGYGEQALLLALMYPEARVVAWIPDADRRRVAELSARNFVNNILFTDKL